MMGQNLYGYDWTLPFVEGTVARALSPQQAIELARQFNVPIQYDYEAQAPFLHIQMKKGNNMKYGLKMRAVFKPNSI